MKRKQILKLLMLVAVVHSLTALAQGQEESRAKVSPVLSFKMWKEQQILESQNLVLRVSNKIHAIKSGRYQPDASQDEVLDSALQKLEAHKDGSGDRDLRVSDRVKKSKDRDAMVSAEQQLRRALGNLDFAKTLSLDDYFEIYVTTLQDQPEALEQLAQRLSKEEIMELLKAWVKRENTPSPNDAKQKMADSLVSELGASRPKSNL